MRKWIPLFVVAGLVLALDQLAKQWVITHMEVGETKQVIPALYPYFQFTRITNTGIAFGIGPGGSTVFLLLSMVITGVLLYVYARTQASARLQQIALAIVLGGAVGNVIDRLRFGHVVDFFHIVIPGIVSNVSNFADHAIVLGVALLVIDSYWQERQQKLKLAESAVPESDEIHELE